MALLLISCKDIPRDNLLDPQNPDSYQESTILLEAFAFVFLYASVYHPRRPGLENHARHKAKNVSGLGTHSPHPGLVPVGPENFLLKLMCGTVSAKERQ